MEICRRNGLDLHEHDAEAYPEFGEEATAPTSA